MEVILLERVEALGQMGDVVSVKAGYARNYLLPRKKALRATKANLEHFEKQRSALEARNQTRREEAQAAATGFGGLSLVLIRSAGESGQLYGSVTVRDIAEGLAAQGVTVDRRQIELASPIKTLGLHTARIRLHPEVAVDVALNVAQSQDEAQAQAAAGLEGDELAEGGISEEAAEAFFDEPARVAHHEDDEEPGEAAGEAEQADERPG